MRRVSVPITADHIGVRIAISGQSSTNCGDNLVACYDAGAANRGILHIQGWSGAGTVTQNPPDGPQGRPLARSVSLVKGTCADPYFSAAASSCTVRVQASVDFGGDPANVGAKLTADVGGTSYPMSYEPATQTWSSGDVSVPPQSGPRDVALSWEETKGKIDGAACKATGKNDACKGSLGVQQRVFSATPDRSGKIALAEVSEGPAAWTNSLQRCSTVLPSCSHSLVVKIGVAGTLELADVGDPPVHLRVTEGSQNQSLDCDPGISQLKDELAAGCSPRYTPNTGTACPGNASALWGTATAVELRRGPDGRGSQPDRRGPQQAGARRREAEVLHRPQQVAQLAGGRPADHLRLRNAVRLVRGQRKRHQSRARTGRLLPDRLDRPGRRLRQPLPRKWRRRLPADAGEIVGHFIKYVETVPEGGETDPCDFNSLDVCAAVLVE